MDLNILIDLRSIPFNGSSNSQSLASDSKSLVKVIFFFVREIDSLLKYF